MELFIDALQFGDVGNGLVAISIIDRMVWRSIVPGQTEARSAEPLSIVKFEQAAAGETIRIIPNRINRNLLIVLDRSELPTVVGDDALTARRPASNKMATGGHTIRIVDGVTGEASQPVILEKR